jgi:hypothetical protein
MNGESPDGISDRAAVITSIAFLEGRLREAIETKLVDDEEARRRLLKPSGPVGSLTAKANLAYLLDIYDKGTLLDNFLVVVALIVQFLGH